MLNESEIICKISDNSRNISSLYGKRYTVNFKIIDQKTIDFDITQSIYPNNGINVADVFRVLAYDCNICVFLWSICVSILK